MSNPIVVENQNTGTSAWQITQATTTAWQMYANALSVNPGGSITFYISTQFASRSYRIDVFRLGYYGGLGGTLKTTISGLSGQAQGYWDGTTLQNCPTAIIDNTTHLIEAGWASSYTLTIPANWITGCYLAKVTDSLGYQTACTFIVLGNTNADYAYVHSYCTDLAYNDWGGWSLYTNPTVGVKDSFNRPITGNYGAGTIYGYEAPLIHWLEYMGYNLSYLSDIDVHIGGASTLQQYNAIIYPCHSEYWTKEMYDAAKTTLASGIGMAFVGANICYWQMRLENDNAGNPYRTGVCYKVQTANNNLSLDPQYGVDNTRVTTRWRDPLLKRPENAMIGIQWSGANSGGTAANVTWTVSATANSPYLTGTGLTNGTSYGTDIVGNEWDNVQPNGPANINIIATSATYNTELSAADISQTTTYVAPSGALVFAAGSICWSWALDSFRTTGTVTPISGMQQFMAHIMTALIRPKNPTGFSAASAFHA